MKWRKWTGVLAALLLGSVLFAKSSWAWGPGVHTVTALSVLSDLSSILPSIANIIRSFPREFIYGCLAADFFVGKGRKKCLDHPHNWEGGFSFLREASSEIEKSFAFGFLSHLAADVVGHNLYIPKILNYQREMTLRGHVYAEIMADYLVGSGYVKLARDLLSQNLPECDQLIRTIATEGQRNMKIRKRLFAGGVKFSDFFFTTRDIFFRGRGVRDNAIEGMAGAMVALSCEVVKDLLSSPYNSCCLMSDPLGREPHHMHTYAKAFWPKKRQFLSKIKKISKTWSS
ncbi:MAG: hypothetical protein C4582_03510 [Desulfobacteraceae bacterium]|jgi:hypothetical protein|nr:MAG: hypothetical protein C4582_03510 [Desulfobacteraceae bacterium]